MRSSLLPLFILAMARVADAGGFPLKPLRGYDRQLVQTALGLQRHTEWVSQEGQVAVEDALAKHKWTLLGGLINVAPYLQGYVVVRGEDLVVAFRGTKGDNFRQTLVNAVEDGKAIVPRKINFLGNVGDGDARVHHGFQKAWNGFRSKVRKRVKGHRKAHPAAQIYVTGHSLGGAIATLAALDLDVHAGGRVQLMASGCPRVGNGAFVKLLETRLPNMLRVLIEGDPIAGIPKGKRYAHAGRLLALTKAGTRMSRGAIQNQPLHFKHHGRTIYYKALKAHLGLAPETATGRAPLQAAAEAQDAVRRGERGESVVERGKQAAATAGSKVKSTAKKVEGAARKLVGKVRRKK